MASATLSAWRPGKRPRSGGTGRQHVVVSLPRRVGCEEYKRALLAKEQEKERRHIEQTIQRLEAIEEHRRRVRERKLDRERRRIAFAELLERSTVMLQRCERGRQARRLARCRARAVAKIVKWMLTNLRRAAMVKAIRNRTILRIMLEVEEMVNEQMDEACFVIKNMVAIRAFRQHRAARIIQRMFHERALRVRRAAFIIIRVVRCWLARGVVRRARIHRSMLRHRGSLSRRALGLPEADPFALSAPAAILARREGVVREGRWWDTGPPIRLRPRWENPRVESEEARSRQRAASLADLIREGRETLDSGGVDRVAELQGGVGGNFCSTGQGKVVKVGFGKGASLKRGASMLEAREAEAAARRDEIARVRERREAALTTDFKRLTVREKHLLRQREFEEQQEKRRLAAEKELQRKEKLKAQEAGEEARRKALEVEILQRQEEERTRKRLQKIREFQQKKLARELAEKKVQAAKKEQERRERELFEAKRRAADELFEKEKAERLERARRRRRAEEKNRGTEGTRRRKEGTAGAKTNYLLSPTGPGRTKKVGAKSRTVLAPITIGNRTEGRRRGRGRLRGGGEDLSGIRRSRVMAGVRDGRLKPPPGASIPALPVVPGWKAMAAGTGPGDRKRLRRRPPRRGIGAEGVDSAEGKAVEVDGVLRSRNASADLDRLFSKSSGGRGMVAANEFKTTLDDSVDVEVTGKEVKKPPLDTIGDHNLQVEVLADDELLTTETLDSAFPIPELGVESGGGEGLGATSASGGLSPGWSSASSNEDIEGKSTSSSFLSDSASIREGQALLLGDGIAGGGIDGAVGAKDVPVGVGKDVSPLETSSREVSVTEQATNGLCAATSLSMGRESSFPQGSGIGAESAKVLAGVQDRSSTSRSHRNGIAGGKETSRCQDAPLIIFADVSKRERLSVAHVKLFEYAPGSSRRSASPLEDGLSWSPTGSDADSEENDKRAFPAPPPFEGQGPRAELRTAVIPPQEDEELSTHHEEVVDRPTVANGHTGTVDELSPSPTSSDADSDESDKSDFLSLPPAEGQGPLDELPTAVLPPQEDEELSTHRKEMADRPSVANEHTGTVDEPSRSPTSSDADSDESEESDFPVVSPSERQGPLNELPTAVLPLQEDEELSTHYEEVVGHPLVANGHTGAVDELSRSPISSDADSDKSDKSDFLSLAPCGNQGPLDELPTAVLPPQEDEELSTHHKEMADRPLVANEHTGTVDELSRSPISSDADSEESDENDFPSLPPCGRQGPLDELPTAVLPLQEDEELSTHYKEVVGHPLVANGHTGAVDELLQSPTSSNDEENEKNDIPSLPRSKGQKPLGEQLNTVLPPPTATSAAVTSERSELPQVVEADMDCGPMWDSVLATPRLVLTRPDAEEAPTTHSEPASHDKRPAGFFVDENASVGYGGAGHDEAVDSVKDTSRSRSSYLSTKSNNDEDQDAREERDTIAKPPDENDTTASIVTHVRTDHDRRSERVPVESAERPNSVGPASARETAKCPHAQDEAGDSHWSFEQEKSWRYSDEDFGSYATDSFTEDGRSTREGGGDGVGTSVDGNSDSYF